MAAQIAKGVAVGGADAAATARAAADWNVVSTADKEAPYGTAVGMACGAAVGTTHDSASEWTGIFRADGVEPDIIPVHTADGAVTGGAVVRTTNALVVAKMA